VPFLRNGVDRSPQSVLRYLQDLPVQGKRVALRLRLSRWRCRNAECEQAIFRERLGEVVAPWARRTSRVEEILLLVGHHSGGRAAEFLLKRLAMSVSDDTILRRIKRVARAPRQGSSPTSFRIETASP
jgi:transposase